MARPKEFDTDAALDSAIEVFREHGYEGTSAAMLVVAMGIGRQSLYDTFGDKWQLYRAALQRYASIEAEAQIKLLRGVPRAIDGIRAIIGRTVDEANRACLGVNSICEFGRSRPDLDDAKAAAAGRRESAICERVREAQAQGDIAADLTPKSIARFLDASFAGIRIAARGGADRSQVALLGELAMRALR